MSTAPRFAAKTVIRATVAAAFALATWHLLSASLLPAGRLSVTADLVRPAPYVELPKPSERLGEPLRADDGTTRVPLLAEPVYLDVKPPSDFETVTVTVRYENQGNAAVEFGALASALDQQYDVRPLEHRALDLLPWRRLSSGTLSLYDRSGKYASVDDFLRNPPPRDRIAAYRADAAVASAVPFRLEGYAASAAPIDRTVSLRGSHRLYVYVAGEDLSLTFATQDMNRQPGADPVTVTAFRAEGGEPVARTVLTDDGNTGDDQKSSPLRSVPLTLLAPKEGAYRVEFTASDDVFVRGISSPLRKLVFKDALYLGDHVGYSDAVPPLTVFTGATRLTAKTSHAEGVQTATFAGKPLRLAEPNVRVTATVPHDGLAPITMVKRSVQLEADGLFALSPDDWFDPLPLPFTAYVTGEELDRRGIDAVLADYEPPSRDGAMTTATVTFDLASLAKTEDGEYRFALSVPGITESLQPFRVADVTFAFRRPPTSLRAAVAGLFAAFRPAGDDAAAPEHLPRGRSFGELIP